MTHNIFYYEDNNHHTYLMLNITDLNTSFSSLDGEVKAVNTVSITMQEGERVGLIGETGCGKTVFGMSIVRLLPPSARVSGLVSYKGNNLLDASDEKMRSIRGKEISFILQNPTASLNPLMRVGLQIAEIIELHKGVDTSQAEKQAEKLLSQVNFDDPSRIARRYPHELSGGMRQKVMIAMGFAGDPMLLIADEPTKSLDPKNRAEILSVMNQMTEDRSMVMITHDLAAAGAICDRIMVMYAGEIVEEGSSQEILNAPVHPYTQAFMDAHPTKGCRPIPGSSPSLVDTPSGCRFHSRCLMACTECRESHPEFLKGTNKRKIRCHCQ